MRLIQYPERIKHDFHFGTSPGYASSKLIKALTIMARCEQDAALALSTEFDHVMKSHVDFLLSLSTCYMYSKIGKKDYVEWESLLIKALNPYHDFPLQYSYVWHEECRLAHRLSVLNYGDGVNDHFRYQIPLVTVEKLKRDMSRIDRFMASKSCESSPLLSNDLYLESIKYLLRLVRSHKGMGFGDEKMEATFRRQINFLEAVVDCITVESVMPESETPKDLLADRQAAIDLALNFFGFSLNCQCFSSGVNPMEVENNIEFLILATYTMVKVV